MANPRLHPDLRHWYRQAVKDGPDLLIPGASLQIRCTLRRPESDRPDKQLVQNYGPCINGPVVVENEVVTMFVHPRFVQCDFCDISHR